MKTQIISLLTFLFIANAVQGQLPQVIESWATADGTQNFFIRSTVRTDPSGNVYVAGATLNGAGDYDILVSKYDYKGDVVWTQQYDGSGNGDDAAASLAVDDLGNVFVTGTTFTSSADTLDAIVIAFDTAGSLRWTYVWAGSDGLSDAGTDVLIHNDYIYVGGFTAALSTMLDFLAVKLDWNGNAEWVSTVDEAGLDDVCTSITKIEGGKFTLAGGTRLSFNDWDYLAVNLDDDDGSLLGTETSSGGTAGFDRVSAMDKDADGNIYLTGTAFNSTTGFDILTIKLDSNLTEVWSETWSGTGVHADGAMDVAVDASGNVWVGGYTGTAAQGTDFILLKYDSGGTLDWDETWAGDSAGADTLKAIAVNENGECIVTGVSISGWQSDFLTHRFLGDGTEKWRKRYNSPYYGADVPSDIAFHQANGVLVAGACQKPDSSWMYITLRYEEPDWSFLETDTSGNAWFEKDAMIIRFREGAVNENNFAPESEVSGPAAYFIDAEVVSDIESTCGIEITSCTRVIPRLSPATTYSLSRGGDTVSMRGLWATVKINYESTASEYEIREALRAMEEVVMIADFNRVYFPQDVPDDVHYSLQRNLHWSPQFGNDAHICMQDAWDREKGHLSIRVGVFDTGIDWTHPDFGGDPNYGADAFVNTIVDGWDYLGNREIWESIHRDQSYHGTSVAGIIGARRNNGIGVAGIAGGDWEIDEPGVSLYSFKIGSALFFTEFVYPALIEGPAWNPQTGFGFGITIANHSWGGSAYDELVHEGFVFSFEQEVVTVSARGNFNPLHDSHPLDEPRYPACFEDELTINTGAAGSNGEVKVNGNGNSLDQGDFNYSSMVDLGVDCIAPGTNALIYSTADIQHDVVEYIGFNGTSAAAPHVSGLAGLMASYHNIQLPLTPNFSTYFSPEDYEYFVQAGCDDRGMGGFDDESGWGLIQACNTMNLIKSPEYYLHHVNAFGYDDLTLDDDNLVVLIDFWPSLPTGNYLVDRYKVVKEISYLVPQGWVQIDSWPRPSGSKGWDNSNMGNRRQYAYFEQTPYQGEAVMSCFVYHVVQQINGSNLDVWIPHAPEACEFEFSIYYETGVTAVEAPGFISDTASLSIFPQPSEGAFTVSVPNMSLEVASIEILTSTGMLVFESQSSPVQIVGNAAEFQLDLAGISAGTYFVSFTQNGTKRYGKLVVL